MVGPYIQFVRNLAALGFKKRGRHPVFNANQFYPFKEERELYEATREEFLAALEKNIALALNGERFGDTLEDLLNNPGELGKDFKSRVSSIGKAIGVKVSADFARQSEMTIGQPYYPPAVKDDLLKTWEENFQQLCISAESDAKKEIARIVSTGKMEGWNKKQVEAAIREKLPSSTKHRAELIARTETGKLNSAARLATFKEVGIEYYKWITTIDGRERHSHALMNKHICSVDDPTVYYEETPDGLVKHSRGGGMFIGNPGEDFQCRCSMVSWDPEIDGTYEIKGPSAEEIAAEEAKRRAAEEKAAQAAAEEAARVEAERVAREAAEKAARIEAERKAAEMSRKVEILQNAAKRHESRSAEERAEIQARWDDRARKRRIAAAAEKRHAERSEEKEKSIREELARRLGIRAEVKNVLKEAEGVNGVGVEELEKLRAGANYGEMEKASMEMHQKLYELKNLKYVENGVDVAKQFDYSTAITIDKSVEAKLQMWENKNPGDLDYLKMKLEKEIEWVENNKKYPSWKVAQDAYKKQLFKVDSEIEWNSLKNQLAELQNFDKSLSKKDKYLQQLIRNAKKAANGDYLNPSDMEAFKKAIEAAENKMMKMNGSGSLPDIDKKELEKLFDYFDKETVKNDDVDKMLRPQSEKLWENLTKDDKIALTRYTQHYDYLNTRLRGVPYGGYASESEFKKDYPLLEAALKKKTAEQNFVVGRFVNDFTVKEWGRELTSAKVGDVFVEKGFLSTAVKKGYGLSGNVEMVIAVPKGAQGVYAEPFSHYNDSFEYNGDSYDLNKVWNGSEIKSFSCEREWIGQRGSKLKVIKKEKKGSKTVIYFQMLGQLS